MKKASVIILYDSENRQLLQHRTFDARLMPDYWAFFGGGIEKGETPEEAVCREAFEELNYNLKKPRFILEMDFKVGTVKGHVHVFIEKFFGDKSVLKLNEGQAWGWFKLQEMQSLKMIDHDRDVVEIVDTHIRSVAGIKN
ncbi:MAG: NUDIX domain-containing protein [Candidatus Scalindua sp.]|jgi:8-oxo-dGTP diphosphatase|nr:NUDIX domain-containing protein [Candidatus Scalindua sp.]MBT6230261.1 NUDIX domain-containing protein [Candidatus Scalindua sp.]